MKLPLRVALGVVCLAWGANSGWAITYDESSDGDLSDIAASTTAWGTLDVGGNLLSATSGGGDFDHVNFTVGAGMQLDTIVLTTYVNDSQSFTALQNGTAWTAGTGVSVNPALALGWTHFGPGAERSGAGVGDDLLDNMSGAAGAIGFSTPLGAGVYNMLLQDTGGAQSYSMTFNVSALVPEPSTASLLVMSLAIGCIAQGRRWRA